MHATSHRVSNNLDTDTNEHTDIHNSYNRRTTSSTTVPSVKAVTNAFTSTSAGSV